MKFTVITGASSGIGLEAAKAFSKIGKNLILIARRTDRLIKLKKEIVASQPKCEIVIKTIDLSKKENCLALYNDLSSYDIETWINNAGFGYYHSIVNQDLTNISQMIHLNIEALTLLSSLYVTDYQDKEQAQLINISSAGGYKNVPNAVTYCATKFYVSAFTEGLALELKAKKASLKAKVLAPAATETEFAQIANRSSSYDYKSGFSTYHTAKEMAHFLIKLYQSDAVVGHVDRDTFEFTLSDPKFEHYQTGINIQTDQ